MRPLLFALLALSRLAAEALPPSVQARALYEKGDLPAAVALLHQHIRGAHFAALPWQERAAIYSNLGTLAHEAGDYREAEHAYRQASRHCSSGDSGELCAAAMSNNLASLYLESADLAKAEREIQVNAKRKLERFGSTSPEVLRWWAHRGSLEYAKQRPKQAAEWYRRSLNGWAARGEPDSLDGLIARSNLGLALLDDGQYAEAILCLEAALRGVERQPVHLQSRRPLALMNLGFARTLAGQITPGGALLRRAVEDARARLGPLHPVTAITMLRHGEFLARHGVSRDEKREGKRLRQQANGRLADYQRSQGAGQTVDVQALGLSLAK